MAKYLIFPGVPLTQLMADTLQEAQNKARGLARSGHETATVCEAVWVAERSDALAETYLGNAVDTAAELSAQVSLENAHADLNAKAATLSLVGGMTEAPTEAVDAADTIHNDIMPWPQADVATAEVVPTANATQQADGFVTQATEAQPDPSRIPINPGV